MNSRLPAQAALLVALTLAAGTASPAPRDREPLERLAASTRAQVAEDPATGTPRWIRFPRAVRTEGAPSAGLRGGDGDRPAAREAEAFRAFLGTHGRAFGIDQPETQLAPPRRLIERSGRKHLSYQQLHEGVPVFGAVLQAHFDERGGLYAVNGTLVPDISLSPAPSIREDAARTRALRLAGGTGVTARSAELVVFRTGLARRVPGNNHLAWRIRVGNGRDVAEDVFVDAHTGKLVERITAIHTAVRREVYEGALDPGALVWQEGDAYPFTGENADAINDLIVSSKHTYDLFKHVSGGRVVSWDGENAVMRAVNNDPGINCPNANWNGESINFCNGTTADDVVAHEWVHAYTQTSHGLVYLYQSGALNESYSDIFGEAVDWSNRARARSGTDAPGTLRMGMCSTFTPPRTAVRVPSPKSLAGMYVAAPAGFGAQLADGRVSGPVVAALPADACEPLTNPGAVAGSIALVDAGACEPTLKVRNAQEAGAIGVIVVHDAEGAPDPMEGVDETITIPAVVVPQQTGTRFRAATGLSVHLQVANVEPSVRWLMGEDATAFEGAIRDMHAPTCFGDPGKVSDPEYFCSAGDGGGVHFNSGVPNHAFALLVDGGTYNGRFIAKQGWTRALAIYLRAMQVYQTPFTNFADHADSLEQACSDLEGATIFNPLNGRASTETVTADTCRALTRAIQATELRQEPRQCGFVPLLAKDTPPLCEQGDPNPLFFESFDAAPRGWTMTTETVFDPELAGGWTPFQGDALESFGRRRGRFLATQIVDGDCSWGPGDSSQVMFADTPVVTVPEASPVTTDATVRLALDHLVATEPGWDGGNVSLRRNGGAWEPVAYDDFEYNGYIGYLYDFDTYLNTNPLQDQDGFTWHDPDTVGLGSFGVSLATLSALAPGDTFQLRFAYGQDGCSFDPFQGWLLDAVQVYTCAEVHKDAARMISPVPGTVLPRGSVQFSWTPAGAATSTPHFRLQLGTGANGPWLVDKVVDIRRTTVGLGGFAPGATVHVRLSSNVTGSAGAHHDYVYSVTPAP